MSMNIPAIIQLIAVIGFTLTAMITDLKWRRIPNALTVSAFVAGLLFHIVTGRVDGLLFALGGFATGFGFLFVLWLIGGGGGGDVKLMGALGTWLGGRATIYVFVLSALMGFICLLAVMVWKLLSPTPVASTVGGPNKIAGSANSVLNRTIPYAVPAGLSAWVVLLARMFVAGV